MSPITKSDFLSAAAELQDERGRRINAAFACTPEFFKQFSEMDVSSLPGENHPVVTEETAHMKFIVSPLVNNLLIFDRDRFNEVKTALDVLGRLKDGGALIVSNLGVGA